jgi:hypothetical protein
VNEKQWLRSTSARRMWACVQGKASARKLRLFACAACRDLGGQVGPRLRHLLALLERVAERAEPLRELLADIAAGGDDSDWALDAFRYARRCAEWAVLHGDGKTEARLQPHWLRCLFGNPWRPLPPRPFPAHVSALARSIYAAFPVVSQEYAILADALEELGEADAAAHCRSELHARGCHVLDWITGRV